MSELYNKLGHWALIDIAIIAMIIYRLLLLIRGTRAMQMVLGILMTIGFAFFISQVYPLTTLKWLMDKFYSSIIIIIVILFQEDIRRVLSRMGKKTVFPTQEQASSRQVLDDIARAATGLAGKKIGALIVIERNIILSRYVDIGVLIDGRISKELLVSIFHPTSPIHDGAVIIQQGRIAAAGCFLPLTRDEDVDPNFGTRHRAAIGISQETDALALAVSEETSTISLMVDGRVSRNLDGKELRRLLKDSLNTETEETESPAHTKTPWAERVRSFFNRGGSK
ncbi:MAG TPA: diadenylate cyclase CdaA [Oligoflexus sp.]|uniref:diadenylate cyclase CdaA n=1 Tax=Oligoflexus sp. TaxID=1971216 RepID=UPI002D3637B0|nr:diadenylate cyclase CdaA [Oligoflexus sp.]HYX33577.1 diadenylate cyclase CdaA [Oligoflexus sp.]